MSDVKEIKAELMRMVKFYSDDEMVPMFEVEDLIKHIETYMESESNNK